MCVQLDVSINNAIALSGTCGTDCSARIGSIMDQSSADHVRVCASVSGIWVTFVRPRTSASIVTVVKIDIHASD